jgi:hypothetical protein
MFHRAMIHHHLEKCILKSSTTATTNITKTKNSQQQQQQSQAMNGEAADRETSPVLDSILSSHSDKNHGISQISVESKQQPNEGQGQHPVQSPVIDTRKDTELNLQSSSSSFISSTKQRMDPTDDLETMHHVVPTTATRFEEGDVGIDGNHHNGSPVPTSPQDMIQVPVVSCSVPQCNLLSQQQQQRSPASLLNHFGNRDIPHDNHHRPLHITPSQETNVKNVQEPEYVASTSNSLDEGTEDQLADLDRYHKDAELMHHPMDAECSKEENSGSCDGDEEKKTSRLSPLLSENQNLEPSGGNAEEEDDDDDDEEDAPPNVFAHMMNSSKRVFARPPRGDAVKSIPQVFHLHEDGTVTLHLQNTFEYDMIRTWSNVVTIKDRRLCDSSSAPAFDVTLSSAIPSYENRTVQWVRRHSRLSVSVLKSILQKSIRRRKPLPAVRCAMELADKSLGELLRRLPVIMLEDSFLHPDLPLLMWLMMAYPRDFIPHPRLIAQVFHIVFEVASCQWSDPLPDKESGETASTVTTLSFLFETNCLKTPQQCTSWRESEALVWSMLVRAEYGGMKGDVEMLRSYADLWYRRFTNESVPRVVVTRVFGISVSPDPATSWQDTIKKLHHRAKEQGSCRVDALASHGIDSLTIDDVCIEGVDFHCSPIIDKLLADEELCGLCNDFLILFDDDGSMVSSSFTEMSSRLASVFKKCIWKHSSGINRRRPLFSGKAPSALGIGKSTRLWNEILSSRIASYQRSYVEQRLVQA